MVLNSDGAPELRSDGRILGLLEGIAILTGSTEEAARLLKTDHEAFKEFLRVNVLAQQAWESGRALGRLRLRRAQLELAAKNPKVCKEFGQDLGQEEVRHFTLTIFDQGKERCAKIPKDSK